MSIPMYVIRHKHTKEVYADNGKEAKYLTYEEAIRMLFILGAKYSITMEKTEPPKEVLVRFGL